MIKAKRLIEIYNFVEDKEIVSVKEISNLLNTSLVTVRRDLKLLEQKGLINRSHGGAISVKYQQDLPYMFRELKEVENKKIIGKAAASFIKDGDCIFLDSGSTLALMSPYLKGKTGLHIITTSIQIINELINEPRITLISIGGTINSDTNSVIGPMAEKELMELQFQKAFLGVSGIYLEKGIFNADVSVAALQKIIVEKSEEIYVLADHTKFNKNALVQITTLDKVKMIITDNKISDEIVDIFNKKDISLIKAR